MSAPIFVAVFKAELWRYVRDVPNTDHKQLDHITHVAYDSTGQRWGFVERIMQGRASEKRAGRGWVKLPTKILDETWEESL